MKLTIHGSRGSMPFYRQNSTRLGVNTSCVRLDMNGRVIILDCGTGIVRLCSQPPQTGFDILLGHLHIDHILGLPMLHRLYEPNSIRLYTKSRSEQPLAEQVFGIFKPPYWPVDLAVLNRAALIEVTGEFALGGGVTVVPFEAEHPDSAVSFRIEGEKTVVYLLDYEVNVKSLKFGRLAAYCENADIVIFDAAYLPGDYPKRRGWGHSTYEAGMALAERSGCKRMIFSHFDPMYTDEAHDYLTSIIADNQKYFLAFDGMEMII